MTITRNFKLCLNAGTQNAPYINANQYDEGEQWIFDLYTEGGQKFTPSTGAIIGIKSDGNAILNSGTVNSDGQVVITETQQMTAASGLAVFELLIEGETHGTANFIVNVERRPSDDAEFSDSDLSMLQEAIDAAEVINEILDEGGDPSEIIAENVNNWLDNHPEATTTVEDGAITAPKINNSLWDKILVNEETSGNPASFDDGADDVPVSSLKVALEPVQLGSGDPSPTNIRPIIASNGKNMIGGLITTSETDYGVTFTYNGNGIYTANGTNSSSSVLDYRLTGIGTYRLDLPVGNYVFNGGAYGSNGTGNTLYLTITGNGTRYVGNNGTSDTAFSIAEGEYISSVFIRVASGAVCNNLVFKPMIRPASITNSSYQPYQGIMVERKGVNQWDEQWELGGISNQNGTNYGASDRIRSKNYIPCLPNTTYYFKTPAIMGTVAFYNSSQTFISALSNFAGGTFTTPANTQYIRFCGTNAYGATYNHDISINYPSTITDYHAYTGTSYPYSLGQSVYGGTVDLATGVLTVDRVGVSLNDPTKWVNSTYTTVDFDYMVIFPDRKKTDDSYAGLICSYVPANNMQANYCRWYSVSGNKFGIKTDGTLTLEQIKSDASAGNIFISYPLATPTTVQLTPTEVKTLLGYNNISSTGTVDVIYHADTKLYIDKWIAELG